MRFALAIGLAAWVLLGSGEVPLFSSAGCVERCPDDDEQGNCAPDCADCAGCCHVRLALTTPGSKHPPRVKATRIPERLQAAPLSPEPGDILHVPIALA
ncbi:MAG: hypothetical protein IT380_15215 [Myxococcales bacterium]|nr:hypothetical protein [Myxococcales bacterium]